MRTRCGFTQIELMVVIAIIAVLAAILFPVFATAQARGRQTQCAVKMKQIVAACLMYEADSEALPPGPRAWLVQSFKPEKLATLRCPELSGDDPGYGFNLKLDARAGSKPYLWDGWDCNKSTDPKGIFDEKLQIHCAPWVDHRHLQTANVAFCTGNVKVFPLGAPDPEVFSP